MANSKKNDNDNDLENLMKGIEALQFGGQTGAGGGEGGQDAVGDGGQGKVSTCWKVVEHVWIGPILLLL